MVSGQFSAGNFSSGAIVGGQFSSGRIVRQKLSGGVGGWVEQSSAGQLSGRHLIYKENCGTVKNKECKKCYHKKSQLRKFFKSV